MRYSPYVNKGFVYISVSKILNFIRQLFIFSGMVDFTGSGVRITDCGCGLRMRIADYGCGLRMRIADYGCGLRIVNPCKSFISSEKSHNNCL